jgi:hypothetical protein
MFNFSNILPLAAEWAYLHGAKIAGVLVAALLVKKFGSKAIEKIIRRAIVADHFLDKK